MRLRFVTSNPGKVAEAQARLGPLGIQVKVVKKKVEEVQADAIADVARHKAAQLLPSLPPPFFLEDAGLHVDALRGFPGVYSHYAFDTLGCRGILTLLRGVPAPRRTAHFLAVVAYVGEDRRIRLFEGRADGAIATSPAGTHGFGFDPIFRPRGSQATFAQMEADEKGRVSHRGRALDRLAEHLGAARRKKP